MQYIATACTNTLKHLTIEDPDHWNNNESMTVLCQSFPHLQTLTLDLFQIMNKQCTLCLLNAVFRLTLQTLFLPILSTTLVAEELMKMQTAFPALQTLRRSIRSYEEVRLPPDMHSPITTMTLVASKSLQADVQSAFIAAGGGSSLHKAFDLTGYAHLCTLTLERFYLHPTELSNILTLPTLENLTFRNNIDQHEKLFDPDTYPETNLAPLKHLSIDYHVVFFRPNKLLTLLHRFPRLIELTIPQRKFWNKEEELWWKAIRNKYRYKEVSLKMFRYNN